MCLCELVRGLCAGIVYLFLRCGFGSFCRPQVVLMLGLHQGFRFFELGFHWGLVRGMRGSSFRILWQTDDQVFLGRTLRPAYFWDSRTRNT